MRKALPPREKLIKGRDEFPRRTDTPPGLPEIRLITVAEYHLFCAGEGCDARLGERTVFEDEAGRNTDRTTLEPRYTNEPHDEYDTGTWWRARSGGYKGMARGRDIRKVQQIPRSPSDWNSAAFHRTANAAVRLLFGEHDPKRQRALPPRDTYSLSQVSTDGLRQR